MDASAGPERNFPVQIGQFLHEESEPIYRASNDPAAGALAMRESCEPTRRALWRLRGPLVVRS